MRALFAIAVLVLVLPFEPMEPLISAFGLKMSHLEVSALVLFAVAASGLYAQRAAIPLAAPAFALLAAIFVSAVLADGSFLLPAKFSLRMTAGLIAFLLTSLSLASAPRFDLLRLAFAAAGLMTAAIALLEAGAVPAVDAAVAPFREHAFEVGGRHRVAATFSYPNTAGGFLALTLPLAMSFVAARNQPVRNRALAFVACLGIFTAIFLTYSRGALLAAIVASAVLTLWTRRTRSLLALNAAFAVVAVTLLVTDPSFRWRASSEGDRSWYLAEITPRAESLELQAGELTDTPVRIGNVGKLTWTSSGERPFNLSYRWFRPARDGALSPVPIEGERTRLSTSLAPGEELELTANVRAPEKPGSYVLIWDMVHEHTAWFSDKVGLGTPVPVTVGDTVSRVQLGAIQQTIAERSWRPGRRELWSIALALFLEHPLFGVGPDNFRWRYGASAGKEIWDTRVFSNSLYLELLSTIGIFGFVAFSYLVARALLGLVQKASFEAVVIASGLAGFLVHGLFDYLLAFTPIYLAFFVLLGAASAQLRDEAAS